MPLLPPLLTKCLLALIAAGGFAVGATGGLSPLGEQVGIALRAAARCAPIVGEVWPPSECVRDWWAATAPRSHHYPPFLFPHEYAEFDRVCSREREASEECLTYISSFNERVAPSPSQ